MPKIKKGLNYFDIETDINSDMRVKLLQAEFGIKGFGIWMQLLIQIYADEGYFMEWDKDTKLLFASDVGESGGLVDEVVRGSVKRGLFDESVFDQFGVLTSKHIQEKYFNAIKRRESEIKVDARYLVIPRNADIISGNVNIKLLNVDRTEQSRVEESKVKESRVNKPTAYAREREADEDCQDPQSKTGKYSPTQAEVESIYQAYPRKVGKGKALKKIEKSLRQLAGDKAVDHPYEFLIGKVSTFAASPKGQAGEYCPYPATWFHQKRYYDNEDEWHKKQHNGSSSNGPVRAKTKGDRRIEKLRAIEQHWPE